MKRNTVKNKVLKTIKNHPDQEWSVREIAKATKMKEANASYHLRTLLKEGQISKVRPGRYQASNGSTPAPVAKVTPLPPQVVVTLDTDEITARLWSEVLRVEIDAQTVQTLSGLQKISEKITA